MAKKLNQISNMPQMSQTLTDWFYPITLVKLVTSIIDFEAVQTSEFITFKGVIQPLKTEEIQLKPEEQRSWDWLQIHCLPTTQLKVGDKLLYDDIRYRVMASKNYALYGYIEYHLVKDYEGGDT